MNTGLNGWLGRFVKRAIIKAAGIVDSSLSSMTMGISKEIGSFSSWAEEIGSGGSSFWNRYSNNLSNTDNLEDLENDPRGNYEPTQLEAIELEKFSNVFVKIITDVSKQQLNVFKAYDSSESDAYKYALINSLLQRIKIIIEFYKYNQTNYLSNQAIELRNLMIEVLFSKIINEVENLGRKNTNFELKENSISIPAGIGILELSPLIQKTSTKLIVNNYIFTEVKVFDLGLEDVIYPIDEIPIDVIDPIDTNEPIDTNDQIDFPNPIEEVGDLINPVATETTKKKGLPWWVYVLGGYGLYKLLK